MVRLQKVAIALHAYGQNELATEVRSLIAATALKCEMSENCTKPVTHVDSDGYVYCAQHGEQRKRGGVRCRKLKPVEIEKLEGGGKIKYQ